MSVSYKLRSAGPASIGGGQFVIQTFGAESRRIEVISATNSINTSGDMAGLCGAYESASWQRLPYAGGYFSGTIVYKPEFLDVDSI